jgi:hypothetical protein
LHDCPSPIKIGLCVTGCAASLLPPGEGSPPTTCTAPPTTPPLPQRCSHLQLLLTPRTEWWPQGHHLVQQAAQAPTRTNHQVRHRGTRPPKSCHSRDLLPQHQPHPYPISHHLCQQPYLMAMDYAQSMTGVPPLTTCHCYIRRACEPTPAREDGFPRIVCASHVKQPTIVTCILSYNISSGLQLLRYIFDCLCVTSRDHCPCSFPAVCFL